MCGRRGNSRDPGLRVACQEHGTTLRCFCHAGKRHLRQSPSVAASYCSMTLTGMRPRSLTAVPTSFAHAPGYRCTPSLMRYARTVGVVPDWPCERAR